MAATDTDIDCSVAIVGAGFAGMGMAIELQRAGIESFTIFEAGDEVGGTWRDNTYPGCACDIPSHLYSYSYELNPDWSRTYSPQREIQDYLVGCAEKYGLYSSIRFNTTITEAHFDDATGLWTLVDDRGRTWCSRFVVFAVGPLREPKIPDLEGLDDFEGPLFHSARWDHDVRLEDRRVGVVGTGASAAQIVPSIAEKTRQVKVFQRSPPWVLPRKDSAYPEWVKRLFAAVPLLQKAYRALIYWKHEVQGIGLISARVLLELFEWTARRYIRECFEDREMRRRVTPDYTVGCKRILISDDYYPALARDDVRLVDAAVGHFTPSGVVDAHGEHHELDAAVLATGYCVEDFLAHVDITGRDGRSLDELWGDGMEGYYGVAAHGFPNMFTLVGPNSGLGHNSIVFIIESQVRLVRQAIETLLDERASTIEVRPAVHRQFNRRIRERLADTVWQSGGCRSWYVGDDGENNTLWPGYTFEYWLKTLSLNRDDFRLGWKGA